MVSLSLKVYIEPGSFWSRYSLFKNKTVFEVTGVRLDLIQYSPWDNLPHWELILNILKIKLLIQPTQAQSDLFTFAKNHLPSYQGLSSWELTLIFLPYQVTWILFAFLVHSHWTFKFNPNPCSMLAPPRIFKIQSQNPTFQISILSADTRQTIDFHLLPTAAWLSRFWALFPNKFGPFPFIISSSFPDPTSLVLLKLFLWLNSHVLMT